MCFPVAIIIACGVLVGVLCLRIDFSFYFELLVCLYLCCVLFFMHKGFVGLLGVRCNVWIKIGFIVI